MGFQFGLEKASLSHMRKFRWLLKIPDVSAQGTDALPPSKSARPSLSFKEMEAQHLNETIFFPAKPEWKPINLTLYDIKNGSSPVFKWLNHIYKVSNSAATWAPSCEGFKRQMVLEMYDGCGCIQEKWIYENAYPTTIDFGDLDMASSEVCMIDMTIRYDRAYIDESASKSRNSSQGSQGSQSLAGPL